MSSPAFTSSTEFRAALDGLRVLDFSQVMAGPFCTMLLADMGADVIKIEPPGGDPSRQLAGAENGDSPGYRAVNRNKRGIVIDLKHPGGVEVCRRLAAASDVLVENFRPGTLDRLGLGYAALRQAHPALIYASISGYGQTGPDASRGGFDMIAQAESGIMSVTGEPGGPPVKAGIPICDLGAGLFLTYAILAAHAHRTRTGEGQRVETSLLEAGIALSVWEAVEYFATGRSPRPMGSAHRMSAPYQAFRCADGYVTIGAASQRTWERFCRAVGLEDLLARPEYATDADRVRHREALAAVIEAVTLTRPREHWLVLCRDAGVPCGPINTYEEVFRHPQVYAREMVVEIEHPVAGRIRQVASPVKASATPPEVRRAAPTLGQHTAEVLGEGGYASAQIAALREEGVIQ